MQILSWIISGLFKQEIKGKVLEVDTPASIKSRGIISSDLPNVKKDRHKEVIQFNYQKLAESNAWLKRQLIEQTQNLDRISNELEAVNKKLATLNEYNEELERLAMVACKTNNAVIITDKEGHIEWVNDGFVQHCGYTFDEIKGKSPKFLQGAKTDAETIKRISEAIGKRHHVSEEIINYTKTGELYWSKLDISPVFDATNQLKNFVSIQTDISELKEYEKYFTSIARELAHLMEHARVPVFGIDQGGFLNEWNSMASALTGFSKPELIGTHWLESTFISSLDVEKVSAIIHQALEGSSSSSIDVQFMTKEGQKLTLLLSASVRRDVANEIVGIIFIGQDITELIDYRTNLEQKVEDRTHELNASLNKEKELVKIKTQFISIASHEFRTPLTNISIASGYIKKYRTRMQEAEIDEKLDHIEKQVSHMAYLLDDILMIGKAEAGKLQVNKTDMDVPSFFKAICKEVEKATGQTHSINLSMQLIQSNMISDEKLLRNIFINLLTNAIKFSPGAKEIKMTITSNTDRFFFKVIDFGIGIPETDVKNLFEPFFRAGNTNTIQGTGLGLSIIRRAIDLLNGSITIKSALGKGTEVQVELPSAQQ